MSNIDGIGIPKESTEKKKSMKFHLQHWSYSIIQLRRVSSLIFITKDTLQKIELMGTMNMEIFGDIIWEEIDIANWVFKVRLYVQQYIFKRKKERKGKEEKITDWVVKKKKKKTTRRRPVTWQFSHAIQNENSCLRSQSHKFKINTYV